MNRVILFLCLVQLTSLKEASLSLVYRNLTISEKEHTICAKMMNLFECEAIFT